MSSSVRWSATGPEFESFVDHHRQQLAVVHFWADWNPLDPAMFDVFDEIHQAIGTDVALARVQVGLPENRDLCRWLGILEVPTVVYVFRNRVVDVRVGFSKNRLIGHVQTLMQRCLAAHNEEVWNLPQTNDEQSQMNLGLSSPSFGNPGFGNPSFGSPRMNAAVMPRWNDGLAATNTPNQTQRQFGLEVALPTPTAQPTKDVQQKSWLSRWLTLE